jgi:hypothetical protein
MNFLNRINRALRLDSTVFEEVESDRSAFVQAVTIVALSSASTIIGLTGRLSASELITGVAAGILAWTGWSMIAYLSGVQLLREPQTEADLGQLLRTTGFAMAPGLLAVLGVIPAFQGLITFVSLIWMLIAFTVAIYQALDYQSRLRATCVSLAGWLLYAGMLYGLPRN